MRSSQIEQLNYVNYILKFDNWVQSNQHLKVIFLFDQVLIQETGEERVLAVGVVEEDYDIHEFPGWFHGTVGYHIDEGRVYDAENAEEGRECEGKDRIK